MRIDVAFVRVEPGAASDPLTLADLARAPNRRRSRRSAWSPTATAA